MSQRPEEFPVVGQFVLGGRQDGKVDGDDDDNMLDQALPLIASFKNQNISKVTTQQQIQPLQQPNRGEVRFSRPILSFMLDWYEKNLDLFKGNETQKSTLWGMISGEITERFGIQVNASECALRFRLMRSRWRMVNSHNRKSDCKKKKTMCFKEWFDRVIGSAKEPKDNFVGNDATEEAEVKDEDEVFDFSTSSSLSAVRTSPYQPSSYHHNHKNHNHSGIADENILDLKRPVSLEGSLSSNSSLSHSQMDLPDISPTTTTTPPQVKKPCIGTAIVAPCATSFISNPTTSTPLSKGCHLPTQSNATEFQNNDVNYQILGMLERIHDLQTRQLAVETRNHEEHMAMLRELVRAINR